MNVFVVDVRNLALVATLSHRLRVTAMAWSAADRLITASDDYIVREWHAEQGKELRQVLRTRRWIWSVACSRRHRSILVGTEDEQIRTGHPGSGHAQVYSLQTGAPKGAAMPHAGTVIADFINASNIVVTASTDGILGLWNTDTGQRLAVDSHGALPRGLRIGPNRDSILVIGGMLVTVWSLSPVNGSGMQ